MASTMHISPGHNLPDNDSIINSISQVISERVSEWCGENISLASPLPEKLTFRNSFFLRFQLLGFENTTRALLVKIPREQDMVSLEQAVSNQELKEMTKSEFDMLIEVYDVVSKLKSTAFTAIRPLFYLPQWNAIVMEELPSRTLEDLAFDLRTRLKLQPEWGQFKDALYLTGQWMRMYHEMLGSWQLAPLKIDDLILEIDQKINLLEPSVIRRVDWNELRAQFRRILDNLRGLSVPYVNLHGDLFLTNVVITPDNRVAVIDLTRMSWGPIYSDLSSVIIELVEQRLKLSNFGFIVREPTILDLEKAVMDGYSDTGVDDTTVLYVYCAKLLLAVWQWYEGRMKITSGVKKIIIGSIQPFIRHYLHREIKAYLARAQEALREIW